MSTTNAPFPTITKIWHSDTYDAIKPSRPELSARGKAVVITGGGSGIGAAIARSFAAAGCTKLALIGRRQNVLDDTAKSINVDFPSAKILTPTADVTKEPQISAAFDTAAKEFGHIDIFISNSGFMSDGKPITESDPFDWWKAFETNVLGQFLAARSFLKHAGKDPTLINITSGVITMPALPTGGSSYVASKIAGVRVSDYLALENKGKGLRVFNFHPGIVESELNEKSTIKALDKIELPGHFAVWIASPEAHFLEGKTVFCNLDVDELIQMKDKIVSSSLLELELGGMSFEGWSPARAWP